MSLYSTTAAEHTMNIRKLIEVIQSNQLIPHGDLNTGLINFMTCSQAPMEVANDLLNARSMGQRDFETAVKYYFLKKPSIKFQKRKLVTFSSAPKRKQKNSLASQE